MKLGVAIRLEEFGEKDVKEDGSRIGDVIVTFIARWIYEQSGSCGFVSYISSCQS